jgi:o-succinylbenzoate---CoA ligase
MGNDELTRNALPPVHWQGRWMGPQELDARVGAAIAGLTEVGVRRGDAIALLGANSPDWLALAVAIARVGAVLVPLSPRLGAEESAGQIERAGVRLVLVDGDAPESSRAIARPMGEVFQGGVPTRAADGDLDPERPQTILFTSGTTGRAKGAVLSAASHLAHARASVEALGVGPGDRWLLCMPLFHAGGLNIIHRCMLAGAGLVLHADFDAEAVSRAIDTDGVTIVSFVETMLRRVIAARGGRPFPPSLRAIVVGGGPIGDDLIDACPAVLPSYGLTESGSMATLVRPDARGDARRCAGLPLADTRMRIVDDEGRERPAGEEGSIELAGPTVMRGYIGDPDATRAAIRDGWLRTGDIGWIDAVGSLHVSARREDLILSGGENIYPAEVEAAMRAHPAVAEVVVVGVEDPEWGQRPFALVVARGGGAAAEKLSVEELESFLLERIARFKIPPIVFVGEIPRLPNGKADRAAIRARYAGGK